MISRLKSAIPRRVHVLILVVSLIGLTGWPGAMQATSTVTGISSWYCLPHRSACTAGYPAAGAFAAAGPRLRVGAWRGRQVRVTLADGRGGAVRQVTVKLVDWCRCPGRLIDLYGSQMARLAPLSRGVVRVAVTW